MAIIKALDSKVGIKVSYHRVIAINLNYRDKKAVICVASYLDKQKRKENYQPLEVVDIEVPDADFNLFIGDNPQDIAYLWLKENVDGFDDSLDDLEKVEPDIKPEEKEETLDE